MDGVDGVDQVDAVEPKNPHPQQMAMRGVPLQDLSQGARGEEVSKRFRDLGVAHLEQYFGVWAIKEDVFRAAVDRVSRMDLMAHVEVARRDGVPEPESHYAAASGASSFRNGYWVSSDGIAVVELAGPLMKYVSSLTNGTSTVRARQAIRAASRDRDVESIALVIDSPGGTVAGTRDLAEEVARAAAVKPVVTYGEDMVASAAYWVGAQGTRFYVNSSALVGSIGTFSVLEDFSAQAAMMGVKVHLIRANDAEFKGAGTPGTEITGKIIDEVHRIVNALNDQFLEAVSKARRMPMERVRELADGRVHVGEAAVKLGLVDGVKSFDGVMEELRKGGTTRGPKSESNPHPQPLSQGARGEEAAGAAEHPQTSLSVARANECLPRLKAAAGDAGPLGTVAEEGTSPASAEMAKKTEVRTMADGNEKSAPAAATLAELKEHLVGASSDFIVKQLEAGATLSVAQKAWATEQSAALAEARKAAEAKAPKPGSSAVADKTVAGSGDDGSDPVEEFTAKVREVMGRGSDRISAVKTVARTHPELHQAYLVATNPGLTARRLITEKYDQEKHVKQ